MTKQCLTCPFLERNRGKPTPTDFKCVAENEMDWYTQENIDGVWEVMRHDGDKFLSCHSTDPDYYGKEGKPIYVCVGASIAVYAHLLILQRVKHWETYVETVGEQVALDRDVIWTKYRVLALGQTSDEWGDMLVAKTFEFDYDEFRWPSGFEKTIEFCKKNNLLPINE